MFVQIGTSRNQSSLGNFVLAQILDGMLITYSIIYSLVYFLCKAVGAQTLSS